MTLVKKGTHPKWSGGFVPDPQCRCGHGFSRHEFWGNIERCHGDDGCACKEFEKR
jgi:hypothetical protein